MSSVPGTKTNTYFLLFHKVYIQLFIFGFFFSIWQNAFKIYLGLPWQSSGQDSTVPLWGIQVQSLAKILPAMQHGQKFSDLKTST